MLTKSLSRVEIKDADKGEVSAVFATLNVIDKDGDVTVKGAFEAGAPCVISAYGHQSWKGKLPVGKGRIRETATEAIFDGRFFLDTIDGLDTFRVVKALSEDDGPGQEWSYGLVDMVTERGDFEGQKVRYIKSVKVPEVSPVLLGAGIDTRTIAAKSRKQANSEISDQLRTVGMDRYGDEDVWVYPDDYDVDEGWVVYSIYADGEADRLVRVSFTRDGGTINLGDIETDVARTVDYAPKNHKSMGGSFAIGDRVRVTIDPPHMPGQSAGTIAEIGGTAYGIVFDDMPDMGIHRWYVASEVEPVGGMKSGTSAGSWKFTEHVKAVQAVDDALYIRASEVVALRASKGKGFGDESSSLLRAYVKQHERWSALLAAAPPESSDAMRREYLRFVALTQGVTTP